MNDMIPTSILDTAQSINQSINRMISVHTLNSDAFVKETSKNDSVTDKRSLFMLYWMQRERDKSRTKKKVMNDDVNQKNHNENKE